MKLTIIPILLLALFSACSLGAAAPIAVETVASGLERPWSLAFLPRSGTGDGEERILVTERPGRLLLVSGGRARPVSGLPAIAAVGQGGLLDIALSPLFAEDGLVYLSFAEEGAGGYGTAVARGVLTGASDHPDAMKCAICEAELPARKDNAFHPFCSERCKLADLGDWFDEEHSVPADDQAPSQGASEASPSATQMT